MVPTDTPADNLKICERKDVTHVVTGLTYGMDAYFSFKKEAKSQGSRERIEGELKVLKLFNDKHN